MAGSKLKAFLNLGETGWQRTDVAYSEGQAGNVHEACGELGVEVGPWACPWGEALKFC